jgi:rSAM/selenodomain-associated transferase 1
VIRLCIFARAPVLGTVKTRLARDIGEAAALAAHEELVALALQQLADVPGMQVELWIAGAIYHPGVLEWSRRWRLRVVAQRGEDLGARMNTAIEASLAQGSAAIVVGTDCPGIDADYVQQAAEALRSHDLVIGPAEDGGYGLIGLRRSAPGLFRAMPWSTDRVMQETLTRARRGGLSHHTLDAVWDVDDVCDWERYRSER